MTDSSERILLALFMAFVGQWFLDAERYLVALTLLLAGVAVAISGSRMITRDVFDPPMVNPVSLKAPSQGTMVHWLIPAVLAIISIAIFDVRDTRTSDWAWWLAAVATMIGSAWYVDRLINRQRVVRDHSYAADPSVPATGWRVAGVRIDPWVLAAAVMVLIAVALRLYRIGELPFGIWYDEADHAIQAARIRNDPNFRPVFIEGTYKAPAHNAYLIAFATDFFGETISVVRGYHAMLGVGSIAALWFASRSLWGPGAALIAISLVAFSRWHITVSRIAMHVIAVPFFAAGTLALLLRAYRSGRNLDYAVAGLFVGIGMGFYSALIASLFGIGVIVLLLARQRRALMKVLPGLVLAAIVALASFGPVLKFAQSNSDAYFARQNETSLSSVVPEGERLEAFTNNLKTYLRAYNDNGDRNARHNLPLQPMLSRWVGALSIIGLGLSLANLKRPLAAGLVVWFVAALLPGAVTLPWEAPNTLRTVGTMIPAYLFAAVPLIVLVRLVTQHRISGHEDSIVVGGDAASPTPATIAGMPLRVLVGVAALLLVGGTVDAQAYFGRQADNRAVWFDHSTTETLASRLVVDNPDKDVWLIEGLHAEPSTMRWIIGDVNKVTAGRFRPGDMTLLPLSGQRDALIIARPDSMGMFDLFRRIMPELEVESFNADNADQPGEAAIIAATIPQESIRSAQRLDASAPAENGDPSWLGGLITPRTGRYSFRTVSSHNVAVNLDGTVVPLCADAESEVSVQLGFGAHLFGVSGAGSYEDQLIEWRVDDGPWQLIGEQNILNAASIDQGLMASHFAGSEADGSPLFRQIDASVQYQFWVGRRIASPNTLQWSGFLEIDQAGDYEFWLSADDRAEFVLDGEQVANVPITGGEGYVRVPLDRGRHPISVTLHDEEPGTYVRWQWAPPGEARSYVSPEHLRPDFTTRSPDFDGAARCEEQQS